MVDASSAFIPSGNMLLINIKTLGITMKLSHPKQVKMVGAKVKIKSFTLKIKDTGKVTTDLEK